jgi:NADH-quinone oxidoreductase subunit H
VPFDISEAEQEIMAGSMLEYSGPLLAIFKLSKLLLLFTLPIFLAIIFLGSSWLVAKYLLIIILMVLIKNTNPRLRIDHAIKFFWGPVFVLAVIAALLSMVRL